MTHKSQLLKAVRPLTLQVKQLDQQILDKKDERTLVSQIIAQSYRAEDSLQLAAFSSKLELLNIEIIFLSDSRRELQQEINGLYNEIFLS